MVNYNWHVIEILVGRRFKLRVSFMTKHLLWFSDPYIKCFINFLRFKLLIFRHPVSPQSVEVSKVYCTLINITELYWQSFVYRIQNSNRIHQNSC